MAKGLAVPKYLATRQEYDAIAQYINEKYPRLYTALATSLGVAVQIKAGDVARSLVFVETSVRQNVTNRKLTFTADNDLGTISIR